MYQWVLAWDWISLETENVKVIPRGKIWRKVLMIWAHLNWNASLIQCPWLVQPRLKTRDLFFFEKYRQVNKMHLWSNLCCGYPREWSKGASFWDDPGLDQWSNIKIRVDLPVLLLHHELSDLGSLILIRINPKERTLQQSNVKRIQRNTWSAVLREGWSPRRHKTLTASADEWTAK